MKDANHDGSGNPYPNVSWEHRQQLGDQLNKAEAEIERLTAENVRLREQHEYTGTKEALERIERLTAENRVMREYIHDCGLSDEDIKMWVECFPVPAANRQKK